MRVLVTGAGGMIGANLALTLETLGHEVHGLDHFQEGRKENLKNFRGTIHVGDIRSFDYAPLGHLDAIFHQAAITDTTVLDRALMMEVNVASFERLLAFSLSTGCPKVVYASSAATYGKGAVPMKEDQPPAPANVYGESKVEMDRLAKKFWESHPKLSVVGLRYFNVYGPLEFHKKAAASMIYQLYQQIKAGKRPRVFKWGEQFRDFVYVKDVVRANLKSWELKGNGIFNVGTGLPTTFNQVLSILKGLLGSTLETDYFDNPYGFYQEATQADPTHAREVLGYSAEFSPEKGIADYLAYLKSI